MFGGCESTQYEDANRKCWECPDDCAEGDCEFSAEIGSELICLSCPAGKTLSNGRCQDDCPRGFYNEFEPTESGICQPCGTNCDVCRDKDTTNGVVGGSCSSCTGNFVLEALNSPNCKESCPSDEYRVSPTLTEAAYCDSCNGECLTCGGPDNTDCLTCPDPNVLDSTLAKLAYRTGRTIQEVIDGQPEGTCVAQSACPTNEGPLSGYCLPCSSNCEECSANICTQCAANYKTVDGSCEWDCDSVMPGCDTCPALSST